MNAQIQTLKAEITADLDAISEIYQALDQAGTDLRDEQQRIVVAYYLHNRTARSKASFSASQRCLATRCPTALAGTPIYCGA